VKVLRRFALDVTPLRTSRDFRLVFAAAGISGFGSFITYVTIPYQVYAITHDPLFVGLLGANVSTIVARNAGRSRRRCEQEVAERVGAQHHQAARVGNEHVRYGRCWSAASG
jgi:hypothetical protein